MSLQGIVLAIIYLLVAAILIPTAVKSQNSTTNFGSGGNYTVTGWQNCNNSGAISLAIISIIAAFIGAAIYVSRSVLLSPKPTGFLTKAMCRFSVPGLAGFRRLGMFYY